MNEQTGLIIHTLRLNPGEDLRLALEAACHQQMTEKDCQAACVISSVGSLSCAVLRYAAEPEGIRLDGPLEIITLSGTLAAPGQGGVHLHARGGHLMRGCIVRTTAEVVLALLPEWSFARTLDVATGFQELVAARRP